MIMTVISTIGTWVGGYAVILFFGVLIGLAFSLFRGSSIVRAIGIILFLPGTVVHEAGHALACLVTGRKIKAVQVGLHGGAVSYDPRTGARTPLASCLVAFAPLLSCGTCAIFLWRYVDAARASMSLTEYVFYVYLIVAMIWGSVPSGPDFMIAVHSFGERPRVTLIEMISVVWPLWLPDWVGIAGDFALAVYLIGVVSTYLPLWLLFVYPQRNRDRGLMYDVGPLLPSVPGRDPLTEVGFLPPAPRACPHATEAESPLEGAPEVTRAYALILAGVKLSRRERKLMEAETE